MDLGLFADSRFCRHFFFMALTLLPLHHTGALPRRGSALKEGQLSCRGMTPLAWPETHWLPTSDLRRSRALSAFGCRRTSADVGRTQQSSSRLGLCSFPSSFLFLVSFLTTLDAHMTLMTFYFIPFHILPFILTHGKPCVILVASRLSDVPTFPRFVGIFVQLPPSYISR